MIKLNNSKTVDYDQLNEENQVELYEKVIKNIKIKKQKKYRNASIASSKIKHSSKESITVAYRNDEEEEKVSQTCG